jgi:uncharacterized membrane protein YfcA
MEKRDEALTLSNPRLLACIYFSLLAVIATLSIDALLYWVGVTQFVPISQEIFLAVIIAACFGALFGERIVHSQKPYNTRVFFWAFLMVMVALPIYNLGFLYFMKENHSEFFKNTTLEHLISMYLFVSVYSFILAGVWLAILAGFAALFLRGYLVYYIKQSGDEPREQSRNNSSGTMTQNNEPSDHEKTTKRQRLTR